MDSTMTLADFEAFCLKIFEQRKAYEAAKKVASEELEKLDALENQMVETLQEMERDNFQSKVGTFYISNRTSVKTPKTEEDRAAFFDYLRAQGVFDSMVTVNSQTLNSWYKKEEEAAVERGEGVEFAIPGIKEVTKTPILGFRKAKE